MPPAAASQPAGRSGQPAPGAAAGDYLSWGWPVTLRGNQVLLTLDEQAIAPLIPTDLATEVSAILAIRQCPAPVLAHPDAPEHQVVLAGEPFGAPLPWPPGMQLITGTLPLPPTMTPHGPVRWVQPPQPDALRTQCREIDLCSAVCTALRTPTAPRPPTVPDQQPPS